jgi:hypothetical protein
MKNIYRLLTGTMILLIGFHDLNVNACTPSLPSPHSPLFQIFPATNLTVWNLDCMDAYLVWDQPKNYSGTKPLGLIGYRIYCNGLLIHYVSDPDSLFYLDFNDIFGSYIDSLTAYYDLTVFGYPGQFAESAAISASYSWDCSSVLPFFEPWDNDSFNYQDWVFSPSQGNWMLNTTIGDPLPAVSFTGTPVLTNYSFELRSTSLNGIPLLCANIYLEFDSRITVNNPTSQEKLIIELSYDNIWYKKDSLVNRTSSGWTHHIIDISEASGNDLRVGFRATGKNSADLGEWDIDNIRVYAVCYKPPDFNLKSTGNVVTLSWQRSCTETGFKTPRNVTSELMGYNVYRTNADSLPPYSKLTRTPIPETTYNDSLPLTNGTYCYYVSAVYQDTVNPGVILCESGSDTLCIHYTGIQEKNESQIRIYPNPVAEVVNIGSDIPFTGIEILDFLGVKVYSKSFSETTHLSVSVTGLPSGNYFLRIQSSKGMIVQKILVDR